MNRVRSWIGGSGRLFLALNILGHFRFFRNRDDLSIVLDWDPVSIGYRLLGVRDQLEDVVHVIFDGEVEAPVAIDASLPVISAFLEFLRSERWMAAVFFEKFELFEERTSHGGGDAFTGLESKRAYVDPHVLRLCFAAALFLISPSTKSRRSATESNGP